ncbi:MAG: HD-GYP domain-containing protein [Spirochaetes bacterium]|nr:HD-GYP domain-containing protein [Spirochaetota bacterium]MBU0956814.1 HD-GYP domain-containing protein [Spirochaetota bacterium]
MSNAPDNPNLSSLMRDIASLLALPGTSSDYSANPDLLLARISQLVKHERSSMQAAETLRIASIELTKNLDPTLVLQALLDYLCWLLPYDYASVSLIQDGNSLLMAVNRDFRTGLVDGCQEGLSCVEQDTSDLARQAIEERKTIMLQRPGTTPEQTTTELIIPLRWEQSVLGVINAERCSRSFSEEQIRYAEALASQAAVAIHNANLFAELKRADRELIRSYDATIEGWSRALELRDHDTEGHTLRVTELTLKLAAQLGLAEDQLVQLRRGSLLHDIGKVAIPDAVLLKPEPLNDEERQIMQRHPEYARQMLAEISYLQPALDIPYCHHERWNGSGYPQGLRGDQIPLAARIFSVVDVWDALMHDRPYHRAWQKETVRGYIKDQSGIFFDPLIVEAFLKLI